MSTRAIIKIEGIEYAQVYKHWDGYPKATYPWLLEFNQSFSAARGCDPEYKFAQLLRDSSRSSEEFNLDPSPHTGWGVIEYFGYWNQEYEYLLKLDGSVLVKDIGHDECFREVRSEELEQ